MAIYRKGVVSNLMLNVDDVREAGSVTVDGGAGRPVLGARIVDGIYKKKLQEAVD